MTGTIPAAVRRSNRRLRRNAFTTATSPAWSGRRHSAPPHRVAAVKDAVDQRGHLGMQRIDIARRRVRVRSGRVLECAEGQTHASAFILSEGWACSYKLLPDGERQIVDFQIPSDFFGLRSILFRTSEHGPSRRPK